MWQKGRLASFEASLKGSWRSTGAKSSASGHRMRHLLGMSESDSVSEPEQNEVADHTLGGYFTVHNRPPAYEGTDGHPYTVSMEIQQTGNLRAPFSGSLVFPRWAASASSVTSRPRHSWRPRLQKKRMSNSRRCHSTACRSCSKKRSHASALRHPTTPSSEALTDLGRRLPAHHRDLPLGPG